MILAEDVGRSRLISLGNTVYRRNALRDLAVQDDMRWIEEKASPGPRVGKAHEQMLGTKAEVSEG